MTRLFAATTAVVLTIAQTSAAASDECQVGETNLKFSLIGPLTGDSRGEAATRFADIINERFDGRFCMTVYGRSELFSDPEVFDAILRGEVHFAAPNLQRFGKLSPRFDLFNLPFVFGGPVQAEAFLDDGGRAELTAEIEDDGFVLMAVWSAGMRQFTVDTPVRTPAQMAGKRIRFATNSPIVQRMAELMDADMGTGKLGQLYDQLESGEFSAQEATFANNYNLGFIDVQAAVVETNHWYQGFGVITSHAFMESLDPPTRAFFEEAMETVTHESNRFAFEVAALRRQDILDEDAIIVTLSEDEIATWKQTFEPLIDEFRDQVGAEFVKKAIRIDAETDPYD